MKEMIPVDRPGGGLRTQTHAVRDHHRRRDNLQRPAADLLIKRAFPQKTQSSVDLGGFRSRGGGVRHRRSGAGRLLCGLTVRQNRLRDRSGDQGFDLETQTTSTLKTSQSSRRTSEG